MRNIFLKILLLVTFISSGQSIEILHQLKKGQQRSEKAQDLSDSFTTRVNTDSGISESTQGCFEGIAYTVDEASLVLSPAAFKASKLYSVEPTDGVGDFTVVRGSVATRINSSGLIEEMADNVPRLDYPIIDGIVQSCPELLLEPQSTNLYLNSDIIVTQNITVTNTDYTVSFFGTGTITFTGTHTGSLVGTGATERVQLTFTPTAGTLISTISGTVTNGQAENLEYSTSFILTAGSTVTRLADVVTDAGDSSTFNSEEGVLYVEMAALSDGGSFRAISIEKDNLEVDRVSIYYRPNSGQISALVRVGNVNIVFFTENVGVTTEFKKFAFKYSVNDFSLWVDGVKLTEQLSGITSIANSLNGINFYKTAVPSDLFIGRIRDLRVFKTALTDAQLEVLTCPDGETCLNLIPFILIGFKRRRKTQYKLAA